MDSVTICNLALGMIGMPEIVSFDEETSNARMCKRFYPVLLDRVLRDHMWSFATASAALQQVAETSPFDDLPVLCALPVDMVRAFRLADDRPFRRFGSRIAVDALPATLLYIRRVTDPNTFDSNFVEALQYLIAAEIGLANTRDGSLIANFRQMYAERLAVARSIDSQENRFAYQTGPSRSTFLASRFRGDLKRPGNTYWTTGTEGKQG